MEESVFDAMMSGWARQQTEGHGIRAATTTVTKRLRIVAQFRDFTNEYPWNWTAAHIDEWTADLVVRQNRAKATLLSYRRAVSLLMDYLLDPAHGWTELCLEEFGTRPTQILHAGNRRGYLVHYEGRDGRRPTTREEFRLLFEDIDGRAERTLTLAAMFPRGQ